MTEQEPEKKRYQSPKLREYGDLRRITETSASGGQKPDGGSYGMALTKTSG